MKEIKKISDLKDCGLVYLATPYTSNTPDKNYNKDVRQLRAYATNRLVAVMFRHGVHVFSPITHNHAVYEQDSNLPTDALYWEEYDTAFLSLCRVMIIYALPGWKESVGVNSEIEFCKKHNIPVYVIDFKYGIKKLCEC